MSWVFPVGGSPHSRRDGSGQPVAPPDALHLCAAPLERCRESGRGSGGFARGLAPRRGDSAPCRAQARYGSLAVGPCGSSKIARARGRRLGRRCHPGSRLFSCQPSPSILLVDLRCGRPRLLASRGRFRRLPRGLRRRWRPWFAPLYRCGCRREQVRLVLAYQCDALVSHHQGCQRVGAADGDDWE